MARVYLYCRRLRQSKALSFCSAVRIHRPASHRISARGWHPDFRSMAGRLHLPHRLERNHRVGLFRNMLCDPTAPQKIDQAKMSFARVTVALGFLSNSTELDKLQLTVDHLSIRHSRCPAPDDQPYQSTRLQTAWPTISRSLTKATRLYARSANPYTKARASRHLFVTLESLGRRVTAKRTS